VRDTLLVVRAVTRKLAAPPVVSAHVRDTRSVQARPPESVTVIVPAVASPSWLLQTTRNAFAGAVKLAEVIACVRPGSPFQRIGLDASTAIAIG
jgi:hypothetical protein